MKSKKRLRFINSKFKKTLILTTSIIGLSTIGAITITSCGVSKSITDNMVDRGDFSKYSTDISFNDVVKMAATSKVGSTAFKNAVANEIAYQ
jgi:hypothetical protein